MQNKQVITGSILLLLAVSVFVAAFAGTITGETLTGAAIQFPSRSYPSCYEIREGWDPTLQFSTNGLNPIQVCQQVSRITRQSYQCAGGTIKYQASYYKSYTGGNITNPVGTCREGIQMNQTYFKPIGTSICSPTGAMDRVDPGLCQTNSVSTGNIEPLAGDYQERSSYHTILCCK